MMEDVVQDAAFCYHQDSEIRNQRNHHMLGSGSCEDTVTSTEPGTWKWMFEYWWWLEVLEVCFSFWGSLAQGKGAGSASFRECTVLKLIIAWTWGGLIPLRAKASSWVGFAQDDEDNLWRDVGDWAFDLIKGGILQLGGVWNRGCIWFWLEFSHLVIVVNLVADRQIWSEVLPYL